MSTDARRPLSLFVLVCAATLIGLGVRNLPARLLSIAGNDVHDQVLNTDTFTDADFDYFVASRRRALAWHAFADDEDDLAAAYTARAARDQRSDAATLAFYRQAMEAQRASLTIEAANPYGWGQMAFLTVQTGGDLGLAMEQLRLSLVSAPYEPKLMLSRLDMMIGLHDYLNDGEREQIPELALAAWKYNAYDAAMTASKHHYLDIIRDAVVADPDESDKFAQLIKDERLTVPEAPVASDDDQPDDVAAPTPETSSAPNVDPPLIDYVPGK